MELPKVPPFNTDAIPDELKRRRQWINWRYGERDGKVIKAPVAPWATGDGRVVSDTDPNNLIDFQTAVEYARKYGFGIGFAFFKGAGIAGVDLDDLNELGEEAKHYIQLANSYCEYSPSGKGAHILGFGELKKGIKKDGIEAYDNGRFFTVTGNHVEGTPPTIGNIQPLLDEIKAKYGEKDITVGRKETPDGGWEGYVNDLGWTLREAREKDRILDEYLKGGLAGKPSPSEADMGTLERLLYWGFTPEEAVSILEFYRAREKLERKDYIEGMLAKLLPVRRTVRPKRLAKEGERAKEGEGKGEAEKYFVDGKFVPAILAEELMEGYHFVTMKDNEQMYVWREGCYRPYAETLIKEECKIRLGEEYRTNRVTEVIDYIKASTFRERREEPPNLIPLKNGVLDLDTMELKPHSPEHMFFNLLPVEYNPEARCPRIEKFLGEITGTEEDVELLLEVIGFCLYRLYLIAKALMLVGEGSNGKSTFLNLVKAFLGRENVSGRSLQDLEENRFAKADLQHKLANIYADLPDRALWRTGTFKMLTGRDLITAERKFQHSFTFENYAKLLFSANKVPEAYDDTAAFFRRWLIVVFPNQFVNDRADPHILEKLTTPEELSGLLNLVLHALKRLLEKGYFSFSKTTEEIREDYIRKSSPIAAFVMDCLETDSDAFIVKKDLYNVFCEYCRARGLPTLSQDTFFKKLPAYAQVTDFRATIEGERLHTVRGLRYGCGDWALSNLSSLSRVFYSLSGKKDSYPPPYQVYGLKDDLYIKVGLSPGQVGHPGQAPTPSLSTAAQPLVSQNPSGDSKPEKPLVAGIEVLEEAKGGVCEICNSRPADYIVRIEGMGRRYACNECIEEMKKGTATTTAKEEKPSAEKSATESKEKDPFAYLRRMPSSKPDEPKEADVSRVCGDCANFGTQRCVMEHPELVQLGALHAWDCKGFVPRRREAEG